MGQWSQLWQRDNTMMMSVSLLYSIILVLVTTTSGSPHDYDRGHPGVRRRVIIVRDHHDDRVRHVRRRVCHHCHQGSVSVVRESRPEVVVVDHGGHGYLQPEPAVVVPAVQTHAVVQTPAVVAPAVHVPAAPSHSSIDPRLIPVLRGSTPQEGDPLGIYPGGGLDPRIDPSLVPEARAQLSDEVRVLRSQLEILSRRLGVTRGSSRSDLLDAGLLLDDDYEDFCKSF